MSSDAKIAGLDSSGNLEFIGIVICGTSVAARLGSSLGKNFGRIHMRELSRPKRQQMANNYLQSLLSFKDEVILLSLFTDANRLRERLHKQRIPSSKVTLLLEQAIAKTLLAILESQGVTEFYFDLEFNQMFNNLGVLDTLHSQRHFLSYLADPLAWIDFRVAMSGMMSKNHSLLVQEISVVGRIESLLTSKSK